LTGRTVRAPAFGYQISANQSEDWTNWVDPASTTHRSKLGFAVVGVLLVVAAFAIGMAFGHGSFEEFADNIRQYLPDKFRETPSESVPGASSTVTPSAAAEPAKADAPAPTQGENPTAQASEAPPNSTAPTSPVEPSASSSTDKEAQAPAPSDSSEAEDAAGTGKAKVVDTAGASAPILMAPAGGGKEPFRLTTPEEAISASSSVAISAQTTVIVPRGAGAEAAQEPKRLQPGALVFRADPQAPKKVGRSEVEIVKLLATVGENGQVLNVQRISGPAPFATAAIGAVREWRYSPTLFDGHPVKTEEKITIVFRR
jgi:protein TonB